MQQLSFIKLSDLTRKVQQAISGMFAGQTYWIVADVTNYSRYEHKGYHYFDLVEKQEHSSTIIAKVAAVAWGVGAERIKEFEIVTGQQFKNDINILAKVSVTYHAVYGLQITLLDIDTNFTIGLLEQQKQQTLLQLLRDCPDFIQKSGNLYITRNNQLELNPVIQQIAVVTSANSAGYQDFKHTLDTNRFGYQFKVDNYFTVVQGETKAELVQQRLIDIFKSGIPYDAVVIIRGGGAQTDFLIFDTYAFGKVVAKFPIPIITGIGHQKNETIVDMMAHSPTKTPTKAAEFIISHNKEFEEAVIDEQQRILIKSQQLFSQHFQELSALNAGIINNARTLIAEHKEAVTHYNQVTVNTTRSILFNKHHDLISLSNQLLSKPRVLVSNRLNDLDNIIANIRSFSRLRIQSESSYVGHYQTVFRLMSPTNILKRGFALVYVDGKIVSKTATIKTGTDIKVVMTNTEINATVKSKNKTDGTAFDI
jgi:exodeoxyribonuclease VII large subunit